MSDQPQPDPTARDVLMPEDDIRGLDRWATDDVSSRHWCSDCATAPDDNGRDTLCPRLMARRVLDSNEALRAALQRVTKNWKMVCERDANARQELDRQEKHAEAAERDLAEARAEIARLNEALEAAKERT